MREAHASTKSVVNCCQGTVMRSLQVLTCSLLLALSMGTDAQVVYGQVVYGDVQKPEDAAEIFPIWPGQPPGTPVTGEEEQTMPAAGGPAGLWVRNVEVPTLTAFLPEPETATGTAVVVAPGGGNLFLSIDNEGYDVARWFTKRGVAAFVLRYRVRPTPRDDEAFMAELRQLFEEGMPSWPHGANDGRQSIRVIRERAEEWNVDPNRIGIIGFSAGGFVVNDVAIDHDAQSRPDFAASIYAGISEPIVVPEDAPPLFIAYAVDDPIMNGRMIPLFTAWRDADKPVEMHAYEGGGHGFGMSVQNETSDGWIEDFGAWMAHHRFMGDEW